MDEFENRFFYFFEYFRVVDVINFLLFFERKEKRFVFVWKIMIGFN